jgi:monofunctional biosynthetic peptidoglycan transglycosylase
VAGRKKAGRLRRRLRAGAARTRRRWVRRAVRLGALAARLVLALVLLSVVAVLALRWIPPPTSMFMVRARLAGQPPLGWHWVDWERIAPDAAVAVIASEDQRFRVHRGFDLHAIGDALEEWDQRGRLRGASTISQQVAKNLFLWPGQSWLRKALEAYYTGLIELIWPKRRILEVYLNVAQFGPGVFGVHAASTRFFDKPPARLTPYEAALLAAVLPSPRRLRADRPSPYVQQRVHWILGQMSQLGGRGYLRGL